MSWGLFSRQAFPPHPDYTSDANNSCRQEFHQNSSCREHWDVAFLLFPSLRSLYQPYHRKCQISTEDSCLPWHSFHCLRGKLCHRWCYRGAIQLKQSLHKWVQLLEPPYFPNNESRSNSEDMPGKQCEVERGQSKEWQVIKAWCSWVPAEPFPSDGCSWVANLRHSQHLVDSCSAQSAMASVCKLKPQEWADDAIWKPCSENLPPLTTSHGF